MRSNFAVDSDVRAIVLKLLRRYPHYVTMLKDARESALTPSRHMSVIPTGAVSDRTFTSVEKLEELDGSLQARVVKAIDDAKLKIGQDLVPDEAAKLSKAVWLSCTQPDVYTFEHFAGLIPCERTKFFKYKSEFIYNIQNSLRL